MTHWEYCTIRVTRYQEGSGGPPRELLKIQLPGAHEASVSNTYGSVGLLNELGSQGWELVDAEGARLYLKRPTDGGARAT